MKSLAFLFERNINDPLIHAQSPTALRDQYIMDRLRSLRSMLGKGGQSTIMIQQQIKELLKNRFKQGWGVTQW